MRLGAAHRFDFDEWFADFVVSPEADRRLWAYCQKYGLRRHDCDDVRQDWYLRVSATVKRSGLPPTVIDAEQATPYVLVAARRVAHDVACRGSRPKEDVVPDRDDRGRPTFEGAS